VHVTLSPTAYARHRKALGLPGGTHVAVLKALRAGRIEAEPDGTIDPAKADAAWNANTDAGRRRTVAKEVDREEPAAPVRPTPSRGASPDGNAPLVGGPSYAQGRLLAVADTILSPYPRDLRRLIERERARARF
jgi:hypothetical protein